MFATAFYMLGFGQYLTIFLGNMPVAGTALAMAAVLVSEDVRGAILEALADYDTVCVGATRSTAVRQALFGSKPEEIGEAFEGTVVITRGREYRPRTVTEGLIDRLSG